MLVSAHHYIINYSYYQGVQPCAEHVLQQTALAALALCPQAREPLLQLVEFRYLGVGMSPHTTGCILMSSS